MGGLLKGMLMNAERSKATPEEENVSLSLTLSLSRQDKKKREGFLARSIGRAWTVVPRASKSSLFCWERPRETFGYNVGVFFLGAFFSVFFRKITTYLRTP